MFADDTAFYCHENSLTDLQLKLNADLAAIKSWLHDNKLTLNVAKSKFMIIGSRMKLSQFNDIALVDNNDWLENVTEFKYLGVTINQYLTWHDHIDQLQSKVAKWLYAWFNFTILPRATPGTSQALQSQGWGIV